MCKCVVCEVVKVRINLGRVGTSRNYVLKDDKGRSWQSKRCPDCVHKDNLARYHRTKKITPKPESDLGPAEVLFAPKLRSCRSCKVMNPNYYDCDSCRSVASQSGCYEDDMFGEINLPFASQSFKAGFAY